MGTAPGRQQRGCGGETAPATAHRIGVRAGLQGRLARTGATVSYEVVREDGPPHDRVFEVAASARGERLGNGSGRSKKEAEQAAASEALEKMRN